MSDPKRLITLTTDFGLRDYYVAAMKGVLYSRAPDTQLVDISHEVAPGDIEEAAFLLEAATPYFPPGTVHLAVVDPGVGSDREILLIERPDGTRLVAPDNGLLDGFIDDATYVVAANRKDLYLSGPGATFHGRDRFAPMAATLARGSSTLDCGDLVASPKRLNRPKPKREPGLIVGRASHIDRYGNVVTDIPAEWIPDLSLSNVRVITGEVVVKNRVDFYSEISAGEDIFLIGSLGFLELSRNGESFAEAYGIRRGQSIEVRFRVTSEDSKSELHRAAPRREKNDPVGVSNHQYPE